MRNPNIKSGGCVRSFKKLDFYGKTLGFHIEGQDKIRSASGASLSLLVFISICLISVYHLTIQSQESN